MELDLCSMSSSEIRSLAFLCVCILEWLLCIALIQIPEWLVYDRIALIQIPEWLVCDERKVAFLYPRKALDQTIEK